MSKTRISRRGFGLMAGAAATTTVLGRRTFAADPIKTAAIYTVPVEQQWVSRIHKAADGGQGARRYRLCVLGERLQHRL